MIPKFLAMRLDEYGVPDTTQFYAFMTEADRNRWVQGDDDGVHYDDNGPGRIAIDPDDIATFLESDSGTISWEPAPNEGFVFTID